MQILLSTQKVLAHSWSMLCFACGTQAGGQDVLPGEYSLTYTLCLLGDYKRFRKWKRDI